MLIPFIPNVAYLHDVTSGNCPWEIGSVSAERVGQGEVGGCTRRVQTAWPCPGSVVERSWLALGGPLISVVFGIRLESSRLAL